MQKIKLSSRCLLCDTAGLLQYLKRKSGSSPVIHRWLLWHSKRSTTVKCTNRSITHIHFVQLCSFQGKNFFSSIIQYKWTPMRESPGSTQWSEFLEEMYKALQLWSIRRDNQEMTLNYSSKMQQLKARKPILSPTSCFCSSQTSLKWHAFFFSNLYR